ncbi:MAG: biosynthetic-type acetolactate synthase large subunit [Firmicutes bacterium]|nr:biosynthetic-type acetolactate synthase large subunit [Bacillota bacterium]
MRITGAQILIEELIRHGVDTIFGYPGGTIVDIYDQLLQHQDRIKHVLTAHEQGAVHAADGYARACGKAGVVLATSGPGATNLVTGIAAAYMDSSPLIAITGNVATSMLGKDSFQEVDIIGVTQQIVKHSFIVKRIEDLAGIVHEAFRIATSDRNGPVLIDFPQDIQQALYEYQPSEERDPQPEPEHPSESDYQAAVTAIRNSRCPYIYCGGGVVRALAGTEVLQLAEKLQAPIGLSMMGLSGVPSTYPLYLGMTGMHGLYAANLLQSEADLIIAVGARFSDRATGNVREFVKNRTIVHIDIDPAEINKNIHSRIALCGDIKEILRHLTSRLEEKYNPQWLARIRECRRQQQSWQAKPQAFDPQNIISLVRRYCDGDAIVATDVGQHQMWVMQYYPFSRPRTLITSGGLGAMGFGLGAAIGASLAHHRRRTVLFTGDGSFGMNLIELATAVCQKIPLLVVIMDNGMLGLVHQLQGRFYARRFSQSFLNRPTDFAGVARAYGAEGYTVSSLPEFDEALHQAFLRNTPVVIDCKISQDREALPMIPPGSSIKDIILK